MLCLFSNKIGGWILLHFNCSSEVLAVGTGYTSMTNNFSTYVTRPIRPEYLGIINSIFYDRTCTVQWYTYFNFILFLSFLILFTLENYYISLTENVVESWTFQDFIAKENNWMTKRRIYVLVITCISQYYDFRPRTIKWKLCKTPFTAKRLNIRKYYTPQLQRVLNS